MDLTQRVPVDLDDQDAMNQLGRCIYCDERCNVDSNYHDYCRQAYVLEEQEQQMLNLPLGSNSHETVTESGHAARTNNLKEKHSMECEDFLEPIQEQEYDDDL